MGTTLTKPYAATIPTPWLLAAGRVALLSAATFGLGFGFALYLCWPGS